MKWWVEREQNLGLVLSILVFFFFFSSRNQAVETERSSIVWNMHIKF